MNSLLPVIAAAAIAGFASPVLAQAPAASAPDAVGVSPEAAQESLQKAVPRSDTATVIRNEESAADQARDAAATARDAADTARERASEAMDSANRAVSPSTADTGATQGEDAGQAMPAPRTDRN